MRYEQPIPFYMAYPFLLPLDQEQAQESLSIENKDGVLDIGLNVTYLLDVLSNIDAQDFCCFYRDGKSSVLISYKDDPNYQHIIMPMRI